MGSYTRVRKRTDSLVQIYHKFECIVGRVLYESLPALSPLKLYLCLPRPCTSPLCFPLPPVSPFPPQAPRSGHCFPEGFVFFFQLSSPEKLFLSLYLIRSENRDPEWDFLGAFPPYFLTVPLPLERSRHNNWLQMRTPNGGAPLKTCIPFQMYSIWRICFDLFADCFLRRSNF